jgi:AP-4 complex subunit mu-1
MIDHFLILNARGVPIAVRSFFNDFSPTIIEAFFSEVAHTATPSPVFRSDNLNFSYSQSGGLYFVIVTAEPLSPALLLELLGRIASVLTDFIGFSDEWTLQKNLGLVYEIVDEILAFGFPQATDASSLRHLVHNTAVWEPGLWHEIDVFHIFNQSRLERPIALPPTERGSFKSEIFIIVNERILCVLNNLSETIQTCITGIGVIKSFLEGSPYIFMQFDPTMTVTSRNMHQSDLTFDDFLFAPFVQTDAFDADRSVTFVPPDGQSTLFQYRSSRPFTPPFVIRPVFENHQPKVVVLRISIISSFSPETEATDVILRFQCPLELSNASCELPPSVEETQSQEFDTKTRQVLWRIKAFAGMKEFSARFRFIFDDGLPCAAERLLGPISLEFTLPHLLSGATLANVVVGKSGKAQPQTWIKEISTAESYVFNFI